MKSRVSWKLTLPLLFIITLLTACGFHLRGVINAKSEIATLAVTGSDQRYVRQLTRSLNDSGIEVVESAHYRINVLQINKDGDARTFASAGRYEKLLKLKVIYQLETQDGLSLFKPIELVTERYVSLDKDLTNVATSEEHIAYQELTTNLIYLMTNRVANISVEKLKEEEQRARKAAKVEKAAKNSAADGA